MNLPLEVTINDEETLELRNMEGGVVRLKKDFYPVLNSFIKEGINNVHSDIMSKYDLAYRRYVDLKENTPLSNSILHSQLDSTLSLLKEVIDDLNTLVPAFRIEDVGNNL